MQEITQTLHFATTLKLERRRVGVKYENATN